MPRRCERPVQAREPIDSGAHDNTRAASCSRQRATTAVDGVGGGRGAMHAPGNRGQLGAETLDEQVLRPLGPRDVTGVGHCVSRAHVCHAPSPAQVRDDVAHHGSAAAHDGRVRRSRHSCLEALLGWKWKVALRRPPGEGARHRSDPAVARARRDQPAAEPRGRTGTTADAWRAAHTARARDVIHAGPRRSRAPWARRASSMRGMSIRTGQISRHAPHRLLACGSSPNAPEPAQRRRQHRSHGAHVDGAVRVSADGLVDGADVQARAAPDAVKNLRQLGTEKAAPTVVHEHDMQFVGAIGSRLAECIRVGQPEVGTTGMTAHLPAALRRSRGGGRR